MAMLTDSLLAEFEARVARGEHINSTVHEEEQLLHAFRQRAAFREALEKIQALVFQPGSPEGIHLRAQTIARYALLRHPDACRNDQPGAMLCQFCGGDLNLTEGHSQGGG